MGGRSEISSNWRIKSITSPENDYFKQSDYSRHGDDPSSRAIMKKNTVIPPSATSSSATLRGENDPRTLQAIEEGRRLYVGNLPYMARTEDVESLFVQHGYQMSLPIFPNHQNR